LQQQNEAAAGAEEDMIYPRCCWIDCAVVGLTVNDLMVYLSERFVGELLPFHVYSFVY
jgi:hypothetical protein